MFTQMQEVLRNFSLRIPAGKVVALVGASGGGKSTVAQLLERYSKYHVNILSRITLSGLSDVDFPAGGDGWDTPSVNLEILWGKFLSTVAINMDIISHPELLGL